MAKRECPVCHIGWMIRPETRTCSWECSKAWRKMSVIEQQARLESVDPDIRTKQLLEGIKAFVIEDPNIQNSESESNDNNPPKKTEADEIREGLRMPKGILD